MPLDEIGRRYADSVFQRRLHEISATQLDRINALRNQHASRGSILSSGYVREHYKMLLADVDSLAQAKLGGLVKAYDKSGLLFDEAAFSDVKHEIVDFCHSEQHNVIGSVNQIAQSLDPRALEAFAKEIMSQIDAIIGRLVSEISIKRDETILKDRRTRKAYAAGLGKQWDAFICHASEDKKDFVDALARRLHDSGLSVWYDVFSLKLGDSLRGKIDEGLANSRYGIVVLSKHFFAKEWPQNELDGLMSREIAGTKVILPIWHKITAEEVRQHSPILAGRVAARSKHGLEKVIAEVREAMGL